MYEISYREKFGCESNIRDLRTCRLTQSAIRMTLRGEFWRDGREVLVRSGSNFYACPRYLIPPFAREFDEVEVIIHGNRVKAILSHRREEQLIPRDLQKTSTNKRIGHIREYDPISHTGKVGNKTQEFAFMKEVVKAIGGGSVFPGELVEYEIHDGQVISITGLYDTSITAVGSLL